MMLQKIFHSKSLQHIGQKSPPENPDLRFKPGEILKGGIIQKLQGGEVIISAKGRQFLAYTELNLREGDKYYFQVKSIDPRIDLKVLDTLINRLESPIQLWAMNRPGREMLGGILSALTKSHQIPSLLPDTRQAFRDLNQLLPAIIYNNGVQGDNKWLSRYLQEGGMFWENRVYRLLLGGAPDTGKKLMASDLKGILMNILKNLDMEDMGDQTKGIADHVRQALQIIEQDQFLNLSSIRDGFGWFWFIPGSKDDGFKKAEVFIKEKHEHDITLSIFLEFSMLGMMETDVSITGSRIGARISVEDREKADYITENISFLKTNLKNIGFTPGSIICDVKDFHGSHVPPFSHNNNVSPSIHLVI